PSRPAPCARCSTSGTATPRRSSRRACRFCFIGDRGGYRLPSTASRFPLTGLPLTVDRLTRRTATREGGSTAYRPPASVYVGPSTEPPPTHDQRTGPSTPAQAAEAMLRVVEQSAPRLYIQQR